MNFCAQGREQQQSVSMTPKIIGEGLVGVRELLIPHIHKPTITLTLGLAIRKTSVCTILLATYAINSLFVQLIYCPVKSWGWLTFNHL